MEAWMKRTADFAVGLVISEKKNPSAVPYRPAKTELMNMSKRSLKRSSPSRLGVSEGRLLQLIEELEGEPAACVHSLMVAKGQEVVLECSAPGYSVSMPHLSHSMSKVLTALAVGLAADDGRLSCDTPVYELLREYLPRERRFYDITVHHLLTMSSGVRFSEAGVVSDDEWCRTFFDSGVSFTPGTKFEYNSMNTYVLARIVKKLCGKGITELLRERIFEPLGIREFFWESSHEGCEKGGFGAFMSLEDWVKIAILVKEGGVYNGRRIISREWVEKCTKKQMDTPDSEGRYSYGYQIWVSDDGNLLFSGMLGQSVLISPKEDIIIAVNSGNNELFQSGDAFAVIDKAMTRGFSRRESESAMLSQLLKHRAESFFLKRAWITGERKKRGLLSRIGLSFRKEPPLEWSRLLGKFDFADNNIGLLPLFIRTMQNNFDNCISDISFVKSGGRIFFVCRDGGRLFRLEIGFFGYEFSDINVSAERYRVGVMGGVKREGDGVRFLLEMVFPEMPNTRRIEIKETGDGAVEFLFSETPDGRVADTFLNEVVKSGVKASIIAGIAERGLGEDFLSEKLRDLFSPRLVGARVGSPNYTMILDGEREKVRLRKEGHKRLESFLVRRFDSDGRDGEGGSFPERLFGAFERIRDKLIRKKD